MPAPKAASLVDIQIRKAGPNGRPAATILADAKVSVDRLSGVIVREITRNADLRKKLGLKACLGCISGMDLDIRHRYDHVLQVNLDQIG